MEPDPVFQKALESFKKDLTVQQRHEFDITTLQDVNDEVNKIQIRHGSAKKLRGMSRMSKFLEAMQQLEQVISVFLNVSEVVAFIWGPIKFFLVVASSRLEILECLLDTFTDISEAMPDLQSYVSIFKDQPEVLEVLKRCYGDIIQFYHMAFGVLGRPGAFGIRDWRRIFDSVWKTFRTKFSPVLGSLRRHRELLVQVKLTATYGAVETTRRALQESIEKSNEELKQILNVIQQKKKQVLDKLGGQGPQSDKAHRRLPDQRYPTSGDWILQESDFLQWLNPSNVSNDLLYLNGMPGAGKTTLISRIIDGMTKETNAQQRPLLNFYFEHGQSGKSLMMDMLRSFIEQLLQQDDAIVDDLHESVLPARPHDLISVSWLEDVATRTVLAQKRCYIVVDGLDECALDERKHVLQWLKSMLSKSKASNVVVKVLVSGQRDGVIDALLQDCVSTIRLDDQTSHLRDIENFSSSVLVQMKDQFPGLEEEKEILRKLEPSRITRASKGMFMYAKVVLDNFLSQTSILELEEELERDYPHGLDEAYDRVAERVLEKTSDSRKRAALEILGLIAVAARPLKWREIQCYFCIDAISGSCDRRRMKVGSPKDLCGSFVESEACTSFPDMPSEAQLTMVHNTAKSYLFRSGKLDIVQQHMQMSLFCFRYLTRPALDTINQDSKLVSTAVLTGYYGLFDYAVAYWDHHSLQYVREQASSKKPTLSTDEGYGTALSTSWTDFVNRFPDRHESLSEISSEHDVPLDASVSQTFPPDAVEAEGESCNIQEIFEDWNSTRRSPEFEKLAIHIRRVVEQTDLSALKDREKAVYLSLNGPFRPKCSRRACVNFNTGFESEGDLLLHISQHEMAFKCPHAGCYAWLAGFPTGALLQRHLKRVHQSSDSEERRFPIKPRNRPRTLEAACRLGDVELLQSFPVPTSAADMLAANRALHSAARDGNLAICVYLTQIGANPYQKGSRDSFGYAINVIQMSIRLGDLDLFLALRGATREQYEIAFIKEELALLDCIIDALESPIPRFLVDLLSWNHRSTAPLTLDDILSRASMVTWRQDYSCGTLSSIRRRVLIEHRGVQDRLDALISTELERYRKRGQPPGLCYEKVLVAPGVNGCSLLHRLCHGDQEHTEAVRFLLTKLRPEDIRRHDSKGNPPLFTAMEKRIGFQGTALNGQANLIRIFFEHNLDDSRSTRNAAGHGPLGFAFRHGALETFALVLGLCGDDYNAVQLPDIPAVPTDRGFKNIRLPFDISDERIRLAITLTPGEMRCFIGLLTDLDSEPEVVKMLEFLTLHVNRNRMSAKPDIAIPTLSDILQSVDPTPTKFLLNLNEADRLLEKFRPEIEALAAKKLRKLLFVSLESRFTRCLIANILLNQHKLEPNSTELGKDHAIVQELAARTEMDPDIVALSMGNGSYRAIHSREAQGRFIETLSHIIYVEGEAQYPDGMRDYIESLIQCANFKGHQEFANSLKYIGCRFP